VACKVSHEALRDHASRAQFAGQKYDRHLAHGC
jgi:hypothetical protein